MNLNSRIFDRIRLRPEAEEVFDSEMPRCDRAGCQAAGVYLAPMGRTREGQYFSFCLDHVREYNASYNYFAGMSEEAVARYQRDAVVGHRPTWSMGVNRAARRRGEAGDNGFEDRLGLFGGRGFRPRPETPRHGRRVLNALATLGVEETADAATIKARYKDWVKRLHPDANGGDRSSEGKLREIIQAYNCLKSARLV